MDQTLEQREKRTCCGKKKVMLESVLFCFLLSIPFSLKTITSEVLYFPPSGWVGKLDACFYLNVNSFLLLHPSGYPDQCVHMTGGQEMPFGMRCHPPFLCFCFVAFQKGQLYGTGKHNGSLAFHFRTCLHGLPEGQTNPTGLLPTQTQLLRKQWIAQATGKISWGKKKKWWQENGAEIYIEFLLSKAAHILVP